MMEFVGIVHFKPSTKSQPEAEKLEAFSSWKESLFSRRSRERKRKRKKGQSSQPARINLKRRESVIKGKQAAPRDSARSPSRLILERWSVNIAAFRHTSNESPVITKESFRNRAISEGKSKISGEGGVRGVIGNKRNAKKRT